MNKLYLVFENARIYDYNRYGLVAFKLQEQNSDTLKKLADEKKKLRIEIYIQESDEK